MLSKLFRLRVVGYKYIVYMIFATIILVYLFLSYVNQNNVGVTLLFIGCLMCLVYIINFIAVMNKKRKYIYIRFYALILIKIVGVACFNIFLFKKYIDTFQLTNDLSRILAISYIITVMLGFLVKILLDIPFLRRVSVYLIDNTILCKIQGPNILSVNFSIVLAYLYSTLLIMIWYIFDPLIDMGVFIYLIFLFPFFSKIRHTRDLPNIDFLNLDYIDVGESEVFVKSQSIKRHVNGRLFRIDLSSFFPLESTEESIVVLNFFSIKSEVYKNKNSRYFYFFANDIVQREAIMQDILISYRKASSKFNRYLRINILLQFNKIGEEIILEKKEVLDCFYTYIPLDKKSKEIKIMDSDFSNVFYRSYQYNRECMTNQNNFSNKKFTDKRKWVLHNGDFGVGKSALDILFVSNAGFQPVVISPWEDHYDNDLLFLIFQRLMENTDNKFVLPTMSVIFFFLASLVSFSYFLHRIMEGLFKLIMNLDSNNINTLIVNLVEKNSNFLILCGWVVAVFSALLITFIVLPYIIIHVKDSSKIHQTMYINKIVKVLQNQKHILIIEDIDRLEKRTIENIFRLISNINDSCNEAQRIIGIVSFSVDKLKKKHGIETEHLRNKVINCEVFNEYDYKVSLKKYFVDYYYFILGLYFLREKYIEKLKACNILSRYTSYYWSKADVETLLNILMPISQSTLNCFVVRDLNFRDVHECLDDIKDILDYKNQKDTHEFDVLVNELLQKYLI